MYYPLSICFKLINYKSTTKVIRHYFGNMQIYRAAYTLLEPSTDPSNDDGLAGELSITIPS
jgi:hypothetical protein